MSDIRDILDIERPPSPEITKETIFGTAERQKKKPGPHRNSKRPEGMCREVFALLYNDSKDAPTLLPTDTGQGYKQVKAKLGMKKVRAWAWTPFENPGRTDGAIFHHWRRVTDENREYTFARFNKKVEVPTYTDAEYVAAEGWSKEETDHLFDLARRFDLRFNVMCDRWDRETFSNRTIEDLKERYYNFCFTINRPGNDTNQKVYVFDADHERRRKEQLKRLFDRTPEQIEEEQLLLNELRKIDARKKEREKKTQDLQKLITAADGQADIRNAGDKRLPKTKKMQQSRPAKLETSQISEPTGIKFPDLKTHGTSVRSQRMKLPVSVGQKKAKAIESLLNELGIEINPIPTEEICQHFNELRSDIVLVYELRTALANCEFELQSLRHQYEVLVPGKTINIPSFLPSAKDLNKSMTSSTENIDVDVVGSPGTPAVPN